MKLHSVTLALALTSTALGKASSSIFWHCMTKYGSTTTDVVPRTTYTRSITGTTNVHVLHTPTKTVTPSAQTKTNIVQVIHTQTTILDVAVKTSTSTVFLTSTQTSTASTATFLSTTFTSTVSTSTLEGTYTVPTAAGFVPVQSSLPSAAARKRSLSNRLAAKAQKKALIPNVNELQQVLRGDSYPAAVTCYGRIYFYSTKTITRTAQHFVTKTARAPTKTKTKRVTLTTTKTVVPHAASSTITTTSTDIVMSTITPSTTVPTTSTSTVTAYSATETAYAMCLDQTNFAGSLSGHGIFDAMALSSVTTTSYNSTQDGTAVGCCTTCANNPLCGFSAFIRTRGDYTCLNAIVDTEDQCTSPTQNQLVALYDPSAAADSEYTLSNGNCAEFTSGGPSLQASLYSHYG